MKKRVRIYKDPNGEGQVINKAAQFLHKAQMGGTPSIDDLSYQGAGQAQSQQVSDDELASLVMQDISNSRPKEEIVVKLVNVYGKEPMEASSFVDQMYAYLEQQSQEEKEMDDEEEEEEEVTSELPENAEEEVVQPNADDFYGDDVNNDMSTDIAYEEEEDVDDTEVVSDLIMRYGGYPKAQEGFEIDNQYPVYFPGIEAYAPENVPNMLLDQYDVATGQLFNDQVFDAEQYKKGGTYKKDKRQYVNSVLNLVKKQLGGQDSKEDIVKKSDQADPTGSGLRKTILDNYIGTLKNQSDLAVAKEQAEQQFDQMMQQQMYNLPMNNFDESQTIEEAQFGGLFRRRRNNQFDGGRGLFNRQPKLPRGMGYYPPIESVDVRRTGIFGRPKEYSINFGAMPVMPGMGVQGYGPGFYGYGYAGPVKYPAKKIVEDQAVYVEDESDKDVAETTEKEPTTATITTENTTSQSTEAAPNIGENGTTQQNQTTTSGRSKALPKETTQSKIIGIPEDVKLLYTKDRPDAAYFEKDGKWYIAPNHRNENYGEQEIFEITDPERIKKIKNFKGDQSLTDQQIPEGGTNTYGKNKFGEWQYYNESLQKWQLVKNPEILKQLKGNKAKSAAYGVLESQPGYYYRITNDGNYVKYKGNPTEHSSISKPIRTINKKDDPSLHKYLQKNIQDRSAVYALNLDKPDYIEPTKKEYKTMTPEERNRNTLLGLQKSLGVKEYGGTVDNPFSDPYGNLQRFVYGGNEDPSLAYITQNDIDDVYSKDTTEAYFQDGGSSIRAKNPTDAINPKTGEVWTWEEWDAPGGPGYIASQKQKEEFERREAEENNSGNIYQQSQVSYPNYGGYIYPNMLPGFGNLFPANLAPQYYTQFMGARNAQGQATLPMLGANANIKSIDVKKSGLLGRPKKYSITFGHQTSDPTKQNIIKINEPAQAQSDAGTTSSIGSNELSRREMARGERMAGRQRPMFTSRKYETEWEDPMPLPPGTQSVDDTYAKKLEAAKQAFNMYNTGKVPNTQADVKAFQQSVSNPTGLTDFENRPNRQLVMPDNDSYVQRSAESGPSTRDYESYVDFYNSGYPLREGYTKEPMMTKDEYYKEYGHFEDGGALQNFLLRAQFGGTNPVVYTNNPAMAGVSDAEMIALNPGIQGLEPSIAANIMNTSDLLQTNMPVRDMSNDPEEMIVQGQQSHQIKKTYEPEGDVTLDFKTKAAVDPQAYLLTGNAAARGALGMIDRFQNRRREREMYNNLTSDNLYAGDTSRDRGDYDTNSGLYRPDEMGQTWNSRSKQFGGQNDYLNEDPDYVDGDEVYMTEDQIQDFLARGGEIEYI